MELNHLSSRIIKAAINVHKALRPGFLESVYQSAMPVELKYMELAVQSDVALPIFYRGQKIHDEGFRIDLVVEETVIIELRRTVAAKETH